MRALNPKLVIYGTTIGFALLTLWVTTFFPFALIVLGLAVVGFVGCYVSTLPLFEYMGAVMASVAIAMVIPLEPWLEPWVVLIPGLVNGYVWGNVVKDHLEGGGIEGLRNHLKKSKKPKKRTSF